LVQSTFCERRRRAPRDYARLHSETKLIWGIAREKQAGRETKKGKMGREEVKKRRDESSERAVVFLFT